jgi:hypothetical protein
MGKGRDKRKRAKEKKNREVLGQKKQPETTVTTDKPTGRMKKSGTD